MAIIYKNEYNQWYLNGSKHLGKSLEKVAKEDPGYIWWLWDKVGPTMTDEMYYTIEETMYKNKIAFSKKKKKGSGKNK